MFSEINNNVGKYIEYCIRQKRLDVKTIRAYSKDIKQFLLFYDKKASKKDISVEDIEEYIEYLYLNFEPITVKRKIASLKGYFHYLEYKEIIVVNIFRKIRIAYSTGITLPKIIPNHILEKLFITIYQEYRLASPKQKSIILLHIAAIETLFSTGIRISELCNIKETDIDLDNGSIRVNGKRKKQRIVQVTNAEVIRILRLYRNLYKSEIERTKYFFSTKRGNPVSDQSIRRIIKKYCRMAEIDMNITPHMFRHTFATCLLEAEVDIRYIQNMLGHASISTTEIYTHVTLAKQKDILLTKHPRQNFSFQI